MKKIILASALFAAMGFTFTGCLKDEGFENHEYGINDPDSAPAGVGFPLATKAKNVVGLDAGVATLQSVNGLLFVNLLAGKPAAQDVHVTITLNNALVTAYNAANGTNIQIMSPTLYNIPTLNVTIPAGQTFAQVPINIPSTVPLDPSNSYGLGFTITAV